MYLHLRKNKQTTITIEGHSQNGRNMSRQYNDVKLLAMRKAKGKWGSGRRGSRSNRVASGPALCLTQPPQRAVVVQQLLVEGAHAAAGEGMQRSLEQLEALGSLYPVLVAVIVQTGQQFLGHRAHSPSGPFRIRQRQNVQTNNQEEP